MEDRELFARLLGGELQLGRGTVAEILGRGSEVTPKLGHLLGNVRLWHTEGTGRVAVFHTVKLLGAMKAESAADALIDAIFLAYGTRHEDVLDELPLAFARIGPGAIGALESILDDPNLETPIRIVAASSLEGVAVLHTSEQERILGTFRKKLGRTDEAGQLRAHLITLLAHFRQPADRALVDGALRTIPMFGDIGIDDIEGYFASSTEPWEWSQYRVDPLEFYDNELA